ncbi:MAG: thrombospondin type 3 repeat-containing protein, partial [Verrucomicrobiota bacterium]|nr:thrombospondin type 3 repeat-containing protein [Verrucomicrobiota bacterium]
MAWMAGLLLGGLAAVVALGQNASVRIEPGEAGVPVLNLSRLADWVDEQWEFYNRITPPWKELVQPLWMEALPVDPEEFPTSFVEQLEGEWEGSIAIYPLSIAQDPDTRETSLYNLSGEPVAVWFGEEAAWPEGMDPSRITFTLDLLDQADEPAYALARRSEASAKLARRAPMTLSTPSASSGLSFLPMELLSNGVVRLTLIHASAPVQIFAYSASPQGSNPRFQGMDGTWSVWGEPLGATNGVAVGEGSLMGPGDSHRFFAAALVQDSDGDGLTDGMELFVHHTDPAQMQDSDGDGLPDGMELLVHHTDPARADTDGDGIPDGVELRRESNPSDFLSRPMPDLVLSAEDADYSWLIQQAVSSNSNADTIIHLSGGLYQVDGGDILELQGTNLVVLGSSDPLNPTILDGRYAGRCIRVQGKNIHLVDLVFRNGAGSPIALGGGLAAYAVDGLILNRCRFEACVSDAGMGGGIQPLSAPAPYGGALYAQGGDV